MGWFYSFRPYVPVAERRAKAARELAKRTKAGHTVSPVCISGRAIANTFWGKAWCENLEGYSDFANRLPRGRTYVRNGSVVDLQIGTGTVTALVSGSELYKITIDISGLPKQKWAALKKQCAGQIGTLVELLRGKLSQAVMEVVTNRETGLFPKPAEIKMRCSCPDYAGMCKHLAAVMYGVGSRLDASPELLFRLRGVNHEELIEQALPAAPTGAGAAPTLAAEGLGDIFGIELEPAAPAPGTPPKAPAKRGRKPAANKTDPAAVKAKVVAKMKGMAEPKVKAKAPAPGKVKEAAPTKPTKVKRVPK